MSWAFIKSPFFLASVLASFFIGWTYGAYRLGVRHAEVIQFNMDLKHLERLSEVALNVSQAFRKIALDYQAEVTTNTVTVREYIDRGVRYVEREIPVESRANFILPEYLVELRKCALDTLYSNANGDVPDNRKNVTCPPALPE